MAHHDRILNLAENREMEDYTDLLDTMFMSYVRSEEYASLSSNQRNSTVDIVLELKERLKYQISRT